MSLTLFEQAVKIYKNEPCRNSLWYDITTHIMNDSCYLFHTSRSLIMGRPVTRGAPYTLITSPEIVFKEPDTWFIALAVGQIDDFFQFIPYPLPYVGWEHKGVVHYHTINHIKEVVSKVLGKTHGVP